MCATWDGVRWRSADPGHIGRVRGFFWLLHVGAGVAADLFSIRAHRRTSRGLLAELESMNADTVFAFQTRMSVQEQVVKTSE